MKSLFVLSFLIMTGFHSLSQKTSATEGDYNKPNIILIISDDLTFRDIEPYGSKEVRTPNLESLAKEGVCLDGMYTATAMCSPTRQQLLTGLFPVRNGAYPNHSWVYNGVKSLPDHLHRLGYNVGIVGKEDFGPSSSFPFTKVGTTDDIEGKNLVEIQNYITQSGRPFCLYIGSHQPHKPWNKGFPDSYDTQNLKVPPYLVDVATTRKQLSKYYAEVTFLDQQVGNVLDILKKTGKEGNTVVIFTSEQGAQFPFAKWTCYENGLKTAFIVRWPGKIKPNTRSEALAQYVDVVPTIIQIAGGNPDTVNTGRPDVYGHHGFDGKSFLPVLLGTTDKFRNYVYGVHTTLGIIGAENPYPIRSIFNGRYKYIRNQNSKVEFSNITKTPRDNGLMNAWFLAAKEDSSISLRANFYYTRPPFELYDIKADPYELHNLADESKYDGIVKKLKQELASWMKQQGDQGLKTELKANSRLAKEVNKGEE